MRHILRAAVLLLFIRVVSAQDGGNMRYVKPHGLSAADIGKFVHLDLGEQTRGTLGLQLKYPPDVVTIAVDGKPVKFIEHRIDDGLNNWFRDQYLEAVEVVKGRRIRITQSKLLSIDGDSIRVESYFQAFDRKARPVKGMSFTRVLSFRKDALAEVLILSD